MRCKREAECGLAFAQKIRFGLAIDRISTQLGLIRTLRGLTPTFGCFDDKQFDELRIERRFSENPNLALPEYWYWVRKLQARYFAGDYAAAADASSRAQRLLWTSPSHFETAEYHFYGALSLAAFCDLAAADQRQQHVQALVTHHRQLQIWTANCPENFENRAALVGAEIARIEGRELDADAPLRTGHPLGPRQRLYSQRGARQRTGRALLRGAWFREDCPRVSAERSLRLSALGRRGQGAATRSALSATAGTNARPRPASTIGAPVEHLDLATVMKVSQAVSGEIVLEKLLDTLMRTAIEQAGAERGLLILARGTEQRIEAEATTSGDTVVVRLCDEAVAGAALPVVGPPLCAAHAGRA